MDNNLSQSHEDVCVVILGSGPAGIGAASQLIQRTQARVIILEKEDHIGGNAGSFELAGFRVDYGSHRLHPSCNPRVLQDIRNMLGNDLLDRSRHGRIYLNKRWIHFPLKPVDLTFNSPPIFSIGVARDITSKLFRRNGAVVNSTSFASVMERSLGKTICQDFYFPYARKIWGVEPEEISAEQAHRRVINNSLFKMVRKVVSTLPGIKPANGTKYYYPRLGFGQIVDAYAQKAQKGGAELYINSRVNSISKVQNSEGGIRHNVLFEKDGQEQSITANYVWSTIPITRLVQLVTPEPSQIVIRAAQNIDYRSMLLVYLVLEQRRFSIFDAHYFPGPSIKITRLSEPKNYSDGQGPENLTVLCAELPCSSEDDAWGKSDDELAGLVCEALHKADIPIRSHISQILVKRIRYAYPIYRLGYEKYFNQLDDWIGSREGLLTFGRQGLFVHDNTHHALYMAYSAVDCLEPSGHFDYKRWKAFRKVFEKHIVED
jgi:protoporphyrinogen oxidase